MATVYREPNQVKWVGVRPGHNGEQILIDIDTAVSVIVYTVPADKLLFLFDWSISTAPNLNIHSRLQIRTAVPVVVANIAGASSYTGDSGTNNAQALWVPIEIKAGYDIYLFATGATRGYIHGILIDA